MSKIKELKEQMRALQDKIKKEGKQALKETFKEIFDKHPVLESAEWVQYTPYFNDGDTCTFRVGDILPVFILTEDQAKVASYEDSPEDVLITLQGGYRMSRKKSLLTVEQELALKDFNDLVKELNGMDDIFSDVFGDHAKVKVSRKGFSVTEYDHE